MGKKSRKKKEMKEAGFSGKQLKDMRRRAKTTAYSDPKGNMVCFNPMKKLVKGDVYKDTTGLSVLNYTVQQYAAYMQQQMGKPPVEVEENKEEGEE